MRKLIIIFGMAMLLAGCSDQSGRNFSIVSGSENTVIEPIVQEFCQDRGFTCSFAYEGSLDIGLALSQPDGVDQDAVWPASSVWVDMFDSSRKIRDLTSIAQTPVVLGVRRSKAEQLGWVGKPVSMGDILNEVIAVRSSFS